MSALLVGLVCTCFMTGLVWFCQVVSYPMLARVPADSYREFQRSHMVRTLPLVTIPMILEAASALALVRAPPRGVQTGACVVGLLLVALIWASTLLFQAPQHFTLARGFAPRVHAALVRCNWIRTAAWSARCVLLVWMLACVVR